ncbi:MAG: helix-turn-helix transcriptional regulator [Firmicutes bacterium]|nr:helix-turn-helix transcriptional regulator [Bacillota bacterium]
MTQQDLAAHLGLSVSAVGGMERGTRVPSDDELHRIMSLLHVTRAELGLDP